MPLFSNPQNPDPGAWEPEAAEGRLSKTVGASEAGVFTSDLSVSEYVLLGEAGFDVISQQRPAPVKRGLGRQGRPGARADRVARARLEIRPL